MSQLLQSERNRKRAFWFVFGLIGGMSIAFWVFNRTTVPATRLVYPVDAPGTFASQFVAPLQGRLDQLLDVDVDVSADSTDKYVKIVLATRDQMVLDQAKALIESAGDLRFMIVANAVDHARIVQLAKTKSAKQETAGNGNAQLARLLIDEDGMINGLWVAFDKKHQPQDISDFIGRSAKTGKIVSMPPQPGEPIDVLMVVDALNDIRGDDIDSAEAIFDEASGHSVSMKFTDVGSDKFLEMTSTNLPVGNRQRKLGFVLDDQLLCAPHILTAVIGEARVSGNFTRAEVDLIVTSVQAGQLPTELSSQPVSGELVEMPAYRFIDLK